MKILTPAGFKEFDLMTKTRNIVFEVITTHSKIICSKNHILCSSGVYKELRELCIDDYIDTKFGQEKILDIIQLEERDTYDFVNVKDGNTFYANNFVSHNCSFLGSSDTLVESEALQRLRFNNPIIRDKFLSGVNLFNDVIEKHNYILSVDTAKDGTDSFSLQIIDITNFPFEQVGCANLDVSYLKMPKVLLDIGTYFNNAFIIIENVEGSGQSVADTLYSVYEYEHLYRDSNKDYPGFRTSKGTRPKILTFLKAFLENNKLILHDKTTIEQLNSFVRRGNKYQADTGSKDDMVMSLAIAFAPFINISSYANYDKFMEALEMIGFENEQTENTESLGSLITIGYFDDGTDIEDERPKEGMFEYDMGYRDDSFGFN